MDPMNRFINTQRQSAKDFLDAICAIPVERTNMTLSASYSTPITILGRLSPVAREGFPSLPYLVDHARNFAALVSLWVQKHPVSASESQTYEGDLLAFHNLCIELHKRAMECYARIETLRAAETASQPTEDLLLLNEAMERISMGGDTLNVSSYGGSSAVWNENEGRPPGSSGSEVDGSAPGGGTGRETRRGRDISSLRQVSRSSEVISGVTNPGIGTVRGLRNGPRKFLSGFIRNKTRTASPDAAAAGVTSPNSTTGREQQRDRDRERDINLERDRDRDRERDCDREKDKDKDKDKGRDRPRDRNRAVFGSSEP
jgi:hypothetical protein